MHRQWLWVLCLSVGALLCLRSVARCVVSPRQQSRNSEQPRLHRGVGLVVALLCSLLCAASAIAFGSFDADSGSGSGSDGTSSQLRLQLAQLSGTVGWLGLWLAALELATYLLTPDRIVERAGMFYFFWSLATIVAIVSLGVVVPAALALGRPVGLLIALPVASWVGLPLFAILRQTCLR